MSAMSELYLLTCEEAGIEMDEAGMDLVGDAFRRVNLDAIQGLDLLPQLCRIRVAAKLTATALMSPS